MSTSLRSTLNALASSFAASVLGAVRSASLEDLLAETGGARRGPGRPPAPVASAPKAPRATRPGRLKRRSPDDIAAALDKIVALVKKNSKGLRAEQIRTELRMQSKEMPRILKEGIAKKKLRSKGQKRATTYFAA